MKYPGFLNTVLVTLALTTFLSPYESALAQWPIPDQLQAKASELNEQQLEFINSGAVLGFIPEQQLEHELATRDAESLRSFVDDLMA